MEKDGNGARPLCCDGVSNLVCNDRKLVAPRAALTIGILKGKSQREANFVAPFAAEAVSF